MDSGNDLLPDGTKSSPEPMMNKLFGVLWSLRPQQIKAIALLFNSAQHFDSWWRGASWHLRISLAHYKTDISTADTLEILQFSFSLWFEVTRLFYDRWWKYPLLASKELNLYIWCVDFLLKATGAWMLLTKSGYFFREIFSLSVQFPPQCMWSFTFLFMI